MSNLETPPQDPENRSSQEEDLRRELENNGIEFGPTPISPEDRESSQSEQAEALASRVDSKVSEKEKSVEDIRNDNAGFQGEGLPTPTVNYEIPPSHKRGVSEEIDDDFAEERRKLMKQAASDNPEERAEAQQSLSELNEAQRERKQNIEETEGAQPENQDTPEQGNPENIRQLSHEEKVQGLQGELENLSADILTAEEKEDSAQAEKLRGQFDDTAEALREIKREANKEEEREEEESAAKKTQHVPAEEVKAAREQVEQEVQQEMREKGVEISKEGLKDFVVETEDGEKIRFGNLSEGKQELALRNYKEVALGEIKGEALRSYREDQAEKAREAGMNAPFLKRVKNMVVHRKKVASLMKSSILKKKELRDREMELKEKMFEGDASQSEFLTEVVKQVGKGPEVSFDKDGKMQLDYLSPEQFGINKEDMSEDLVAKVEQFNLIANQYAGAPENPKNKGLKETYQNQRDEIIKSLKETQGHIPAMKAGMELDRNIEMNRHLNNHPDLEKKLSKINSKWFWLNATMQAAGSKGGFAALGYTTRSAVGYGLAGVGAAATGIGAAITGGGAALAAGGAVGGLRGYFRGKTEASEREQLAKGGKGAAQARNLYGGTTREFYIDEDGAKQYTESEEKYKRRSAGELAEQMEQSGGTIENITNAESMSDKLDGLLQKLNDESTSEEERAKLEQSLSARIAYTRNKLESDKINFGEGAETIKNQYKLFDALARAEAEQLIENDEPTKERLESFLDIREERIDRAKKKYYLRQAGKGAKIGATFAIGGSLLHDAVSYAGDSVQEAPTEEINLKEPPTEEINLKDHEVSMDLKEPSAEKPQTHEIDIEDPQTHQVEHKNAPSEAGSGAEAQEQHDVARKEASTEEAAQEQTSEKEFESAEDFIREQEEKEAQEGSVWEEASSWLSEKFSDESAPDAPQNPQEGSAPEAAPGNTPEKQEFLKELNAPYEVKSGDTIWGILENKLKDESFFQNLNEHQQRIVIDSLKDRVTEMSNEELKEMGIESGNPHELQPGQTLSLNKVYENTPALQNALEQAQNWSPGSGAEASAGEAPEKPEMEFYKTPEQIQAEKDYEAIKNAEITPDEIPEPDAKNVDKAWHDALFGDEEESPESSESNTESSAESPETIEEEEVTTPRDVRDLRAWNAVKFNAAKDVLNENWRPGMDRANFQPFSSEAPSSMELTALREAVHNLEGPLPEPKEHETLHAYLYRIEHGGSGPAGGSGSETSPQNNEALDTDAQKKAPEKPDIEFYHKEEFDTDAPESAEEKPEMKFYKPEGGGASEASPEAAEESEEEHIMDPVKRARAEALERQEAALEQAGKTTEDGTRVADVEMSKGEVTHDNLNEEPNSPENSIEEKEYTEAERIERQRNFAEKMEDMPAEKALYSKQWNEQENNPFSELSRDGEKFMANYKNMGVELQNAMKEAREDGYMPKNEHETVSEFVSRVAAQDEDMKKEFKRVFGEEGYKIVTEDSEDSTLDKGVEKAREFGEREAERAGRDAEYRVRREAREVVDKVKDSIGF